MPTRVRILYLVCRIDLVPRISVVVPDSQQLLHSAFIPGMQVTHHIPIRKIAAPWSMLPNSCNAAPPV